MVPTTKNPLEAFGSNDDTANASPPSTKSTAISTISSSDDDESNLSPTSFDDAGCARPLPKDFKPGNTDVVLGRGKKCFGHVGNELLRFLVTATLEEYSAATSRSAKSLVILKVVDAIRANSPHGGFVKQDSTTSRWFEVGDFLSREKTSQTFRDALAQKYKSSKQSKKRRRDGLPYVPPRQPLQAFACPQQSARFFMAQLQQQQQQPVVPVMKQVPAPVVQQPAPVSQVQFAFADDLSSEVSLSTCSSSLTGNNSSASEPPLHHQEPEEDLLALLAQQFLPSTVPLTDNPFEPTPLRADAEDPFEPTPLCDDNELISMDIFDEDSLDEFIRRAKQAKNEKDPSLNRSVLFHKSPKSNIKVAMTA